VYIIVIGRVDFELKYYVMIVVDKGYWMICWGIL
jgi:hypothetical protein